LQELIANDNFSFVELQEHKLLRGFLKLQFIAIENLNISK
jgi:hypothetical protein